MPWHDSRAGPDVQLRDLDPDVELGRVNEVCVGYNPLEPVLESGLVVLELLLEETGSNRDADAVEKRRDVCKRVGGGKGGYERNRGDEPETPALRVVGETIRPASHSEGAA